jgi:hypothetical protein
MRLGIRAVLACALWAAPVTASAQTGTHQHPQPSASPASAWHFMQDGVAWFTYNNQGGPRGGAEYGAQNWWMGMLSRPASGGTLQFNVMLSLDPLTLGPWVITPWTRRTSRWAC